MSTTRSIYKVFRSILFSAVLTVLGLVAALYIIVSVPGVQRAVKSRAERELTSLLGGRVEIGEVDIYPFNEVRLHAVSLYTPGGVRCVSVGRLGAGIDLWKLISTGDIEVTYAEIISLNARVEQSTQGGPLNIQYIIDALSGKEKKTPPPRFRVRLHNVVIRKSNLSFHRTWVERNPDPGRIDFNHIDLRNFRVDVAFPIIANDDFSVDLRRLAFEEESGFSLNSLSCKAHITPAELQLRDFKLRTERSEITLSDQTVKIDGYGKIMDALRGGDHSLQLEASPLCPADFAAFFPPLSEFVSSMSLTADIHGNLDRATLNTLEFSAPDDHVRLSLSGYVSGIGSPGLMAAEIERLDFRASSGFISQISAVIPWKSDKPRSIVASVGDFHLMAAGYFSQDDRKARGVVEAETGVGNVKASGSAAWSDGRVDVNDIAVHAVDFRLGSLLSNPRIGSFSADVTGDISVSGRDIGGGVSLTAPYFEFNSNRFENITAEAVKKGRSVTGKVGLDGAFASLDATVECEIAGESSLWNLDTSIAHLVPAALGVGGLKATDALSGDIVLSLSGNKPDNMAGSVEVRNFNLDAARKLHIEELTLSADLTENGRSYVLGSDFLNGTVSGDFNPTAIVGMVRGLLAEGLPSLITPGQDTGTDGQHAEFSLSLLPEDNLYAVLGTPVRPGVPLTIDGSLDGTSRSLDLMVDAPYLVKGNDKLIKNTVVDLRMSAGSPITAAVRTQFPLKNDMAGLNVTLTALADRIGADLGWKMEKNPDNTGNVGLDVALEREPLTGSLGIDARLRDSGFRLNGASWDISPGYIDYAGKSLRVNGLRISHGPQFVDIHGSASESPLDVLTAELAGIDLEYIFNILNINHVDFGGIATGRAVVTDLFSKAPVAQTDGLFVKNLAYNGCVLGDGQLESHWDNEEKMVAINADIAGADTASATVRGGVYVTRDSLSFDFTAKKLDIEFLQPFMSGFTSSVRGRASGELKLYGTFSDIDLGGWAYADTITMLVDQTNVYYSGADTVRFSPGRISIPRMRLYDKYGHSGLISGEVRHDYLRDAQFRFDFTDVRDMLVYDTGPKVNPRWYGHVFASGTASLRGIPGLISININMRTGPQSEFTLVLDETQTAIDYRFLTFTDKRGEAQRALEVEETFEDRFRKRAVTAVRERQDVFSLDLALDVRPGTDLVIVMDPQAGDKISANGSGALQMHYDSDDDKFDIYGKYTLERGNYNFSLQDLILKNFTIRPGSSISFNGDPLAGLLDITAAYRVNTNLKDLDRSFESDPDLNRTSVPVDALLKVRGDIHAPEINFDISLPTVTSDVERKVRSIVSTEDMMNRQVIYLLALNRFYTPEYMGAEQGGELASVASSTLSSQLQNIIGSLTDKFSLAPSFKSEKSDLSDMEVDVALSSSLFDNRLLLNGNLGYRDRSTSQTTFIGDFDLEYLLSRDGKLRLKAYNHFNDASYYLKSALTTQGMGIIYRKEFNDPFAFIKRMFRKKNKTGSRQPDKENKNNKK